MSELDHILEMLKKGEISVLSDDDRETLMEAIQSGRLSPGGITDRKNTNLDLFDRPSVHDG